MIVTRETFYHLEKWCILFTSFTIAQYKLYFIEKHKYRYRVVYSILYLYDNIKISKKFDCLCELKSTRNSSTNKVKRRSLYRRSCWNKERSWPEIWLESSNRTRFVNNSVTLFRRTKHDRISFEISSLFFTLALVLHFSSFRQTAISKHFSYANTFQRFAYASTLEYVTVQIHFLIGSTSHALTRYANIYVE